MLSLWTKLSMLYSLRHEAEYYVVTKLILRVVLPRSNSGPRQLLNNDKEELVVFYICWFLQNTVRAFGTCMSKQLQNRKEISTW